MTRRATVKVAILIAATAGMTLAFAAPASAAGNALPSTDTLYALSCTAADPSLLEVDASTGESTPVGPEVAGCRYNAAFDEVTGTVYYNAYDTGRLASVDVATGAFSPGTPFTLDGMPIGVTSIAIGAHREAYAFGGDAVYALNLDTGALTAVAVNDSHTFYAFAYDPATKQFYALSQNGDLFLFNRAALTLDPVGTLPIVNSFSYGLQFDSSGLLWYVDTVQPHTVLFSATLADLANPIESGPLTYGEATEFYSFSFAITRPLVPELAATGSDGSALGEGALAAAVVLLLGAGAVVVSRRRTV